MISPYLLALATLGGTTQIDSFLLFENNLRLIIAIHFYETLSTTLLIKALALLF